MSQFTHRSLRVDALQYDGTVASAQAILERFGSARIDARVVAEADPASAVAVEGQLDLYVRGELVNVSKVEHVEVSRLALRGASLADEVIVRKGDWVIGDVSGNVQCVTNNDFIDNYEESGPVELPNMRFPEAMFAAYKIGFKLWRKSSPGTVLRYDCKKGLVDLAGNAYKLTDEDIVANDWSVA